MARCLGVYKTETVCLELVGGPGLQRMPFEGHSEGVTVGDTSQHLEADVWCRVEL